MHLISHRGFWKKKVEQNSLISIKRSFQNKMGIEVDVRLYNNKIYVSHDHSKPKLLFDKILKMAPKKLFIAINIKEDGLGDILKQSIKKYKINNYFCFDMSFPEMIKYKKKNLNIAERMSDYEKKIFFNSKNIWIDQFKKDWCKLSKIKMLLKLNKRLFIVSNELHSKKYINQWSIIKKISKNNNIYLCTDKIIKAKAFFNL